MRKDLAIKGHPTRGKEVIELLEMMGGNNRYKADGTNKNCTYIIRQFDNSIIGAYPFNEEIIFTLEEFLEKYPYKVGDKVVYEDDNDIVVISEIKWDNTVGDIFYNVKRIDEEDCFLCPPELLKPYKETNMNKKLAIEGHPTRGKEVIELLEMMGGKNIHKYDVIRDDYVYTLSEDGCILAIPHCNIHLYDRVIFTLEEFLEKYPFKVGDKVFLYDNITVGCVTGMKWDEETVKYCVYTSAECWCDVKELLKWNAIDLCEKMNETQTKRDIDKAEFMIKHMILPNKMDDKLEYEIINGYEFDRVENNKIILKPIKTEYPKTYKECCDVLLIAPYYNLRYHTYEHCYNEYATSNTLLSLENKLNTLGKLIICRDAYWKIAGKQKGVGKPWEPDWDNLSTNHEFIKINKGCFTYSSRLLVFPTEEMRDAFYENFKHLIEQCEKLL